MKLRVLYDLQVDFDKRRIYRGDSGEWTRIRRGEELIPVRASTVDHVCQQTRGGDLLVEVKASADNFAKVGAGNFYIACGLLFAE